MKATFLWRIAREKAELTQGLPVLVERIEYAMYSFIQAEKIISVIQETHQTMAVVILRKIKVLQSQVRPIGRIQNAISVSSL